MFGTYRYILANIVVLGHLFPALMQNIPGPHYAVYGFYALSGFLMTLILHNNYGFTHNGIKAYLINRFLRIFPTYWMAIALSLFFIIIYPFPAQSVRPCLVVPDSFLAWLQNIFILGLGSTFGTSIAKVRMIPPSWALHIELLFFLIMPLIVANKKRVLAWALLSILFTIYALYSQQSYPSRYLPVQSASLPFSLGALFYFISEKIDAEKIARNMGILVICIALFFVNLLISPSFLNPQKLPFYINIFLNIMIITCLMKIPNRRVPRKIFSVDKFLGDLSYPIFLIHWPVAVLASVLFLNGKAPSGFSEQAKLFCFALPTVHLLSIVIHLIVEKRIQNIREAIRPKINNT